MNAKVIALLKGKKLNKLASEVGLTESWISRMLNKKGKSDERNWIKVAKALNVSVGELRAAVGIEPESQPVNASQKVGGYVLYLAQMPKELIESLTAIELEKFIGLCCFAEGCNLKIAEGFLELIISQR